MRTLLFAGLAVLLPASAHVAGAEDARGIIKKAIQAHGGEAKLARLQTVHVKAKAP
jgi:hypothetical protein